MKVKYTGRYVEKSVSLCGVAFQEGKAVEVTPEWFDSCKNPNVKEVKAVKKQKKAKADDDSKTNH